MLDNDSAVEVVDCTQYNPAQNIDTFFHIEQFDIEVNEILGECTTL